MLPVFLAPQRAYESSFLLGKEKSQHRENHNTCHSLFTLVACSKWPSMDINAMVPLRSVSLLGPHRCSVLTARLFSIPGPGYSVCVLQIPKSKGTVFLWSPWSVFTQSYLWWVESCPPKTQVEVLTTSAWESDLIWKYGHCRCNRLRSWTGVGWVPIQ